MIAWHFLTGEYPPQEGGVSDYCHLLARSLVHEGDTVDVWAPATLERELCEVGIQVHRLSDHFGADTLRDLDKAFKQRCPNRRLLVHYVPHAFGWKAMNVPLCYWLYGRRHRERIWVMFHEVAYPISRKQSLKHNFLGIVNWLMAGLVSRAAERCFVSTQAWLPMIQRTENCPAAECLPIPSTLPTEVDGRAVAAIRARFGANDRHLLIGHFGTFGTLMAPRIEAVLPPVLAGGKERLGLLLGRGGEASLARMIQAHPEIAGRVFASGPLPEMELSTHLAACDLLIQPYPDGVTTRRTSLMAGLALGVPIVTTTGHLTESFWCAEGIVALAPADSPRELAAVADRILRNSSERKALGQQGNEVYRRRFSMERTIESIRSFPSDKTRMVERLMR